MQVIYLRQSSLFTQEDFKGKIIYLQEVAGSQGADFAIRVLQSAQHPEYEVTEKADDGSFRTVTYRKEGPVVVVQTTTEIRLYHENDTRVFPIDLDETAEQTERIQDDILQRAETGGIPPEDRDGILRTWRDAIRLLESQSGFLNCDYKRGPQGFRYTLALDHQERQLGISLRPPSDEGVREPDTDTRENSTRSSAMDETDDEDEGEEDHTVEASDTSEEGASARSLNEKSDESEGDPEDYLDALTDLGWFRSTPEWAGTSADLSEPGMDIANDPVARKLRRAIDIYSPRWGTVMYRGRGAPWVGTAEDVFGMETEAKDEQGLGSGVWLATP